MRLNKTKRNTPAIAALTAMLAATVPAALADDTVALKNALYGAGYEVDNVNSSMDDATRSALRDFQQDQGLEVTGQLDDETKSALGIVPVDVAASEASQTSAAGNSDGNSDSAAEQTEAEEDEAVEEDDDGGWSLF